MSKTFDINTLSESTGVNVRTIRYYLAEGLLPPPEGRGPAASYGPGHRDRLRLIRRLQDAHQPLAAIRTHLEALDDAGVAASLAEAADPEAPTPSRSAQDYVREVLVRSRAGASLPPKPAPSVLLSEPAVGSDTEKLPPRSTWERISIHPDLELHVRRPLARADQRRLDELLDQARRLFGFHP
jgi:DNA-binding transcriptional MerR regulator